ncbi:hypothetical protein BN8_p06770 (plasmid) [Fibrisoma limi BUZ 3]|uniref:Uncharacterized protein n=1 Tax=Fibrisoma limi BUZ 3 TaxID=1185876 RepID=I2GTY0_9BACT|nr:hypothetical protein [Fibrisoma limi]CCH57581.1 hypothetical protein BN8_p06770 [Fibrisoma limi BUZ 3]
MKTIVNAQELVQLVEQSHHFFTSIGGITLPIKREVVQQALTEAPTQCSVGYQAGILFIYSWIRDGINS